MESDKPHTETNAHTHISDHITESTTHLLPNLFVLLLIICQLIHIISYFFTEPQNEILTGIEIDVTNQND